MQPQGSALLNTAYYTAAAAAAAKLQTCSELQAFINTFMASIQAEKTAIEAQIASLAPVLALLTAPTSPTAAVTWITNYITSVLTPQYLPYINYAIQVPDLLAAIATLTTAFETAASNISGCSITVPPLT